jgi:hypothetical protein
MVHGRADGAIRSVWTLLTPLHDAALSTARPGYPLDSTDASLGSFFTDRENGAELRQNDAFVRDTISLAGVGEGDQPSLWQDRVRLDDGFWQSLPAHPVPVREEAIRAIGARSLAIDVYIWLAYRLHSLEKSISVSWAAIHGQFGAGFRLVRQIKPSFTDALSLALAVYPEARVDIDQDGIVLHPSPPAVPRYTPQRLGLY